MNQKEIDQINRGLMHFLDSSPNAFFAVANMKRELRENGCTELFEGDPWKLEAGKGYYVSRNDSALIAFRLPNSDFSGFQMMASHCDSPVFKVKPNAEITVENRYVKLNVERYGSMLCAPWLDRPLSVAGRLTVRAGNEIVTKCINIDRDLLVIPNLAIHMDRQVNEGHAYNAQVDMLPLLGDMEAKEQFMRLIAAEAGVREEDILDTDLYLYNREKATRIGLRGEFLASGRLDDLQCAFASLQGFLRAVPFRSVALHCVYDNEEVGSRTKQGAASTFLKDVLRRICVGFGKTEEEYLRLLASSFLVSADNAHAVHPNHGEKADPTNRPFLNGGIVIKYSANQSYTTDAVSGALFRLICERAEVPYQIFVNRSDMLGGSTLGNLSNTQVALNTADIGLPQLAMHSPYETGGTMDTAYLVKAAGVLFSSSLEGRGDGTYRLMP